MWGLAGIILVRVGAAEEDGLRKGNSRSKSMEARPGSVT